MAPRSPLHEDVGEAEFDAALGVLEAELRVVFAAANRVEAAGATLRRLGLGRTSPLHLARVLRLVPLATARVTPANAACVTLLRDLAATSPEPWLILRGLLAAPDPAVPPAIVDDALALASRGALLVDDAVLQALARAVERENSPLATRAVLEKIAALLQHAPADAGDAGTLLERLTATPNPAVQRLIARVLDLPGVPPDPDTTARILGPGLPDVLASCLEYGRATHLDLVDVRAGGSEPPLATCLPLVHEALGPALTREVIASLGWSRMNLGLEVRPCVGISVNDSLPLLVTPAEASLFDACPDARRAFDRFVILAHGGRPEAAGDVDASPGSASEHAADDSTRMITRFRAYNLLHAEVLGQILDIAPRRPG
jgi:hypothetical protein